MERLVVVGERVSSVAGCSIVCGQAVVVEKG